MNLDNIQPYQFEPERDEIEDNDTIVTNEPVQDFITSGRSGNSLWCKCKECMEMENDEESVCCYEFENIRNPSISGDFGCVTINPSFGKLILDREVLNVTRYLLGSKTKTKWKNKLLHAEKPLNKTWRYVAYKQFVSWINAWMPIGFRKRVVIPSCVIKKIRQCFPEVNGKYVGFKNYKNDQLPA